VRTESILAGNSTHIIGKDFELAFDNESGALRQCVAGNQPLLLEFPKVHVLPAADPEHALPLRREWQLVAMDVNPLGTIVDVTLNGKYPDFDASLTYRVFSDGNIDLQSKFTYTGKEIYARELGTSFSVPRACDILSWTRNAEWNAYPDDHIGRPSGSAVAFPVHPSTVPPAWAWSQDLTPMGSNDFRGTKRHLVRGAISYPGGGGVEVISDGKQALRAMAETDRISLFVSDWYGGTNVGWDEWITNYGRGKLLKNGDVVSSHLRLRLVPKRG
jgi:hypothetical protein